MFARTFVVNLPNRTDRRRDMERELRSVGLKAEFFPAFKFDDPKPFHRLGSRGNYMSQLAILKSANGAENVAMLEDDLNFVRGFSERVAVFKLLPTKWALFYGGHNGASLEATDQTFRDVSPMEELIGAHFYVVNGYAIPLLIDALETFLTRERDHPLGGPMPVDGALNIFRQQHPALPSFAATPALGYQRSSRSDCDTGKRIDNTPVVSTVVAGLRRVKDAAMRRRY